jgi:hypothetical protein
MPRTKGKTSSFELRDFLCDNPATDGQTNIRRGNKIVEVGKGVRTLARLLPFALPCRDDYPIRLATASKCLLAYYRKSLYLNQTMQLMEADAFDLILE